MLEIRKVRSPEDILEASNLAWAFVDWLRNRYPERAEEIEAVIARSVKEQLDAFDEHFFPPRGECLLAELDGVSVGLLMLRDMGGERCEMNRMFVSDAGRGQGVAKALVKQLQDCAREMGFTRMTLGALERHYEALALYRKMGFVLSSTEMPAHGEIRLTMLL